MRLGKFFIGLSAASLIAAPACFAATEIRKVPNTVVDLPLTGMVTAVNLARNQFEVRDDFGQQVSVNLDRQIQVLKNGRVVSLQDLNPADTIVVMTRR